MNCKSILIIVACLVLCFGCRSLHKGRVMNTSEADKVGSHSAGAETYTPLVEAATRQAIAQLDDYSSPSTPADDTRTRTDKKRICFLGVENETSEELGDFREHIYETIDTSLTNSGTCVCVSRWAVDGALQDLRLRPDQLFDPRNREAFTQKMGTAGQPFDYMAFARITSGTTVDKRKSQKNYKLVLEFINVNTGEKVVKTSADLRKEYK